MFDINLTIKSGEIIILSGPSGSGKTTLLTLIAGLRSVQDGSLRVLGKDLYRTNNRELLQIRRQLGYIFQDHNLVPFLNAIQNVQVSLKLNKILSFSSLDQFVCVSSLIHILVTKCLASRKS